MRPGQVTLALARLAGTREGLLARSSSEIAEQLGRVGERFEDLDDPLVRDALEAVGEESGFSAAMVRRIVRGMARDWSRTRLADLLAREFDDPAVLDRFVPDPRGGRLLRAVGDRVAVHIGSGSVPGVSTTSMIRSLLVKTPVLVKPGRGDRALTKAFWLGLEEEAPVLAGAADLVYWSGDEAAALDAAVRGASRVVAYGSDAATREVRAKTPVTTPIQIYHHRFSVAVLGPEAARSSEREAVSGLLARAASTFDQRGCVSPHRVYLLGVEPAAARELGEALALAMAVEARDAPPGPLDPAEAARLQQLRAESRMRSALGPDVAVWSSPDASWTVVLEPEPPESVTGHPRTLVLVPVADQAALVDRLRPLGPHLQSVGLAGLPDPSRLVDELAELGVTRVTSLRELPFPPAWWIHDGTGPLRALVRWVEWEP